MRGRFAIAVALLVACAAALPVVPSSCSAARAYVGLYADQSRTQGEVWCDVFTPFHVWVWIYVYEGELSGFEYKLSYPDNVLRTTVVTNTFVLPDGDPDDPAVGIRATFDGCQTGWIWTHYQSCYLLSNAPGKIRFIGYPESEAFLTHDCDAERTLHVPRIYGTLFLNQPHYLCGPEPPYFMHVAVESPSGLRARLTEAYRTLGPESFLLISETDPPDTIRAIQAVKRDSITYGLTFESPMIDHTTYRLRSVLCNELCWCCEETWPFLYEAPIATELKRSALALAGGGAEITWELWKVDPGTVFLVSRSCEGGEFVPLGGAPIEEEQLCFRYLDRDLEPGRGYVYEVDVSVGGDRRALFTTDRIVAPAVPFELGQNVPNPFNPTTTISFTLPEARPVTLEIYDVSGHLVARLLDKERMGGGGHAIEWNGRDGFGREAGSGVYLYRLSAGKTIISRKMVLLR